MSNPALEQNEARQLMPAHIEAPGMEPWLRVMAASLVPAVSIIFVPQSLQIPFAITAGLLLAVGTCILIAERWKRRNTRHP